MIKKIICIFMTLILLMTCFSACQKSDKSNKNFGFAVSEMPRYFDPQSATTNGEKIIAVNIFDGLFKMSPEGKPEKCCVNDYTVSDDGLIYTFTLRDDCKYYLSEVVSNYLEEKNVTIDNKITAKDFEFGIKRALAKETDSADYELLTVIKNATDFHDGNVSSDEVGVKAIDDYTLQIELNAKDDKFLYALSQPVAYPCNMEFFKFTGGRYGLEPKYTLSNGPFYLSKINDDKSVKIKKNEEYTGNFAPIPSSVNFFVNENEVEVAKKLNKDNYDCGFFVSDDSIKEFSKGDTKIPINNITKSLIFNGKCEKIQNVKLRTGLISAIDMQAVTEKPYKKVLPSIYGIEKECENIESNIDFARESLTESFKEDEISSLNIEVLCEKDDEEIAKAIVNRWQTNIGVELVGTVKSVDKKEFDKLIKSGDYETAVYPLMVDSTVPGDFLSIFATGSDGNILNYSSEEYDELLYAYLDSPTEDNAVYCESFLLKNAVLLPIVEQQTIFTVAKGVEGIYFSGDTANVYFYKGQK